MILDNFSLEKILGKGSFGEVYLTTKKGTNKLYATKKIPKSLFERPTLKKYLVNECMILKELNHPNIVKFEDIKKTVNNYYIIMEYCNGGELSKTLEDYQKKYNRAFPQEMVQYLMRQIVAAFKYIHGRNIIHRDIKLENILLNYDNEQDKLNMNIMRATVKIIDFGFAAKMDKSGLKYTTLGSPVYMDPLILQELKNVGVVKKKKLGYDQRADIWSIGNLCYEMLIGKNVFDADDLDNLVKKVEEGKYTVPTSLSKEVISFLNGTLQYNLDNRLNIEQLSKHIFLTKDVKDFENIDLKKVSKRVEKSQLVMNIKGNQTIWSIFDQEDEKKLNDIKPELDENKKKIETVKNNTNNNAKIETLKNKNEQKNNINNIKNNNNHHHHIPNNNMNRQNQIRTNNIYQKRNSYPYGFMPQQYPNQYMNGGYPFVQGMPYQTNVGAPMMTYTGQPQSLQGYCMPGTYPYTYVNYYK